MEFRSRPAGGMSPGTDAASLRVITTAVLVGLVASGVALASGLGLLTGGAGAQRPLAGQALANGPAQAAGLKLLREAAQACRSLPYQGVELAWWGPGSQTGGDTSVVQVWHQPGGQADVGGVFVAQEGSEDSLAGYRFGREIGVADDKIIAMAHCPQSVKHIGIEQRIDRFQHYGPPPICFFG